jgi:hypothetical protein
MMRKNEKGFHPSEALNFVEPDVIRSFIDRIGYDVSPDGCHLWRGYVAPNGYARGRIDGLSVPVHRAAWVAENGPMTFGLDACHKCDVRNCINPEHIFPGSRRENMQDCALKKRLGFHTSPENMPRGERHGAAKLTLEQAMEVWASCDEAGTISKRFGIDGSVVCKIKKGSLWQQDISDVLKFAVRNNMTATTAIRALIPQEGEYTAHDGEKI